MTHGVRMVISQVFWSSPCGSGTRCWVDQIQPKHLHLLGEGNKEWFSAFLLRLEIKDLNVDGLLACVYCLKSVLSFLLIYNFLWKHNLTKMTVLVWNRAGFCLKQGFVWNFETGLGFQPLILRSPIFNLPPLWKYHLAIPWASSHSSCLNQTHYLYTKLFILLYSPL